MKKGFFIVFVIISVAIIAVCFLIPNNRVVPAFDEAGINLVIEGDIIISKDKPKIIDDEVLIPIDIIKKYFDPNIHWDSKSSKVTITTRDKVIRMKTDSLNAIVNNKPVDLSISVKTIDNEVYIPIEFLSNLYKIQIRYSRESDAVIVDRVKSIKKTARLLKDEIVIRKGHSKRYPIVKKLKNQIDSSENMDLIVFDEYEKWYKVRAFDGTVGYIEKKSVTIKETAVKVPEEPGSGLKPWKPDKGRINLVWEMMYSGRPSISKLKRIEGLDVISPTWFQLSNDTGDLINRADARYVEWAHKNNYKIWALFSNGFSDAAATSRFLNNTDARDNAIRQILAYAALYKIDGINIDFENVFMRDKEALTQFVREITPLLREQGLVVSIDVTVPDGSENYSLCYDRKALGEAVDYVMLMAYDQHWRTSPVAGSIAQVSWVEENLNLTLKYVPKEKLILGMPFYTRLWKQEKKEDGSNEVSSSKGLSMEKAKSIISENNAKVSWDEESGQFYAEYREGNATCKIWYEDENSINLRSSLVLKYGLAGTASWSKNNETPAVWETIRKNLKDTNSYDEWLKENKDKKYVFN